MGSGGSERKRWKVRLESMLAGHYCGVSLSLSCGLIFPFPSNFGPFLQNLAALWIDDEGRMGPKAGKMQWTSGREIPRWKWTQPR